MAAIDDCSHEPYTKYQHMFVYISLSTFGLICGCVAQSSQQHLFRKEKKKKKKDQQWAKRRAKRNMLLKNILSVQGHARFSKHNSNPEVCFQYAS